MQLTSALIHLQESAPVTNVGQRTLLTLLVVAVILLSVFGMARGWRRKTRSDLSPINTQVPSEALAISTKVSARFAGTTTAGNWLDRVTNYELGTPRGIDIQVFNLGVFMTDDSGFNLWIPKSQILNVTTGQGIAGDVVEKNGMLIFTWQLGDTALDTGVRVSRHSDHELIVTALQNFPSSKQSSGSGLENKTGGAGA